MKQTAIARLEQELYKIKKKQMSQFVDVFLVSYDFFTQLKHELPEDALCIEEDTEKPYLFYKEKKIIPFNMFKGTHILPYFNIRKIS